MSTPTAKLPSEGWTPGRVTTWDSRHTVAVSTKEGPVQFIFDVKGRTYRFSGVERTVVKHDDQGSPIHGTEKLGPNIVARATWMRIYKADAVRRGYFA